MRQIHNFKHGLISDNFKQHQKLLTQGIENQFVGRLLDSM